MACLPRSMFTRHPHESRGRSGMRRPPQFAFARGMTKPRLSLPIGETAGKFFVSAPKSARSDRKSPVESSSCSAFPDRVGREKPFPAAGSGREVAGKCNSRASIARARAKINTIMAKVISRNYGNFADYEMCGQQQGKAYRRRPAAQQRRLVALYATHAVQDRDGAGLVLDKIRRRFPWLELIWADGGYDAWQVELRRQRCRRWARRSSSAATT